MSKKLKIVFLGTPDFAAASLKKLVEHEVDIVAVITAPDKPKGRGKKMATSTVKDYALSVGLPVLQPTNLKSPAFIEELASYQADLQIVVAFRMLPVVVWDMPPLGTFNLHGSLLPQYRGAAPINWAVMNGETETGVTTFFLKHEIDTGKIIFQEKEPIKKEDTVGSLYERLMHKGADLVLKTVRAIAEGDYPQIPQPTSKALKHAPKIFKEDCKINWHLPAEEIRNFVRGLSPYPAAWSLLDGKTIKIFQVAKISDQIHKPIGKFYSDGKTYLRIKTQDGTLDILDLQMEGKKRMLVQDFLRGYQINDMTISMIAAMGSNRVIGKDNDIPWHLPNDFKYFKNTTKGHHVIMGRKNWESLPPAFQPLPDRPNIVITRQANYEAHNAQVVGSLSEALDIAKQHQETEAFIIGGGEIYRMGLLLADRIYLTEIAGDFEGQVTFPALDQSIWKEVSRKHHPSDERHNYAFDFVVYEKKAL